MYLPIWLDKPPVQAIKRMKQFIAFVIKETKHILRDKRTMLILFGMPVVMMLLFGFAITTDVKNVRTVLVTSEMSPRTQQAVERLAQSEYFIITQTVNTPQEAELLIRSQKADMSLTPSPSPIGEGSSNLQWQIMVDGSGPNMAQQWTTYAQSILSQPVDGKHYSLPSPFGEGLGVRLLYNPQMKSAYNFVPAIMGMLLMLICHHGYAADAHLCHDDLDIDCPRERERYDGGTAGIACAPLDGNHR